MGEPRPREGLILRAVSGFYYVRSESGLLRCRARGRFRREGLTPLVGDRVTVVSDTDGTGVIDAILPRKNAFDRPAAANVDYIVMLLSAALPVTDPLLVDRITVRCEKNRCGVLLVLNKCDLDPGERLRQIYAATGYGFYPVSAVTGRGVAALRSALEGKVCCFTGNSGVGKSSLINALSPGLDIPVGEVSRKLGRGRHTTRHVELFDMGGGTYVCDTPGFASFEDERSPFLPEELAGLFPEFAPYLDRCRFDDCTHRSEPGCALRDAVQAGAIHPSRYNSYLRLYGEAEERRRWEPESKT